MRTYVENGKGKIKRVRNRFGGYEKAQHCVASRVRRNGILNRDLLRQFADDVADDRDIVVTEACERCPTTGLKVEPNGTVKHRSGGFTLNLKYDDQGRVLRAFTG